MKKFLITGGSGFIGSHTCYLLLKNGYELVVVDSHINSSPDSLKNVRDILSNQFTDGSIRLNLKEGDIRDFEFLFNVFKEENNVKTIDGVIHFAGQKSVLKSIENPLSYWESNVSGSINLFKVMDYFGCRTIVFSSSATVYSPSEEGFFNEHDFVKPVNPYGNTKACIEKVLSDLFHSDNKKWRIANLRYFNPAGSFDSFNYIGNNFSLDNLFPFINLVAAGRKNYLNIFGNDWDTPDGTCIRDYIHIMDLSEAHIATIEMLFENNPQYINLNIGTGVGVSVLDVVKTFSKVNNLKIPYKFVKRRRGDVKKLVADNKKAIQILNWVPHKSLSDICKDSWKCYLSN